jgi:hypothetical protein
MHGHAAVGSSFTARRTSFASRRLGASPWTLAGTTPPNSLTIKCGKPHPNLGEPLIFIRSAEGLLLNLQAGGRPLRRRP